MDLQVQLDALEKALNHSKAEAFGNVYNSLTDLKGQLEETLDTNTHMIERAVKESERGGGIRKKINFLLLVMSIASAVGGYLKYKAIPYSFGPPSSGTVAMPALWLTLMIVGSTFVAWLLQRLLGHRTSFDVVLRSNYERRRSEFIDAVERDISAARAKIVSELRLRNGELRNEVRKLYDTVIEVAEKARLEVIAKLEDQVKAAARLAEQTAAVPSATKERAGGRITDIVNSHLNGVCEETDARVRDTFGGLANELGAQCTERLQKYVNRYREVAREIVRIRTELRSVRAA
jgi:hypothetical protein